jgi:hypothetical protein
VVALAVGGTRESVMDGQTGVLVDDGSVDGFAGGLERVRQIAFDPATLRRHAERFGRDRFLSGFQSVVDAALRGVRSRFSDALTARASENRDLTP